MNVMLEGENIKLPQWIEGVCAAGPFVLRVVDAVIPIEDPTEPCFEPEAIRLLDHLQNLADAGDLDALAQYGDVYVRRSA